MGAEVVTTVGSLRTLLLRGFLFEPRRISDAGGRLLARAVANSRTSRNSFNLELDYQQVGCATAEEMSRCWGAWSRLSLFNTEVSTMGAMALANVCRQHPGSAKAVQLNVAQCRLGTGAVELLKGVGFLRLDSHGQRMHTTEVRRG